MEILRKRNIFLIVAFSIFGFAVMGYHPGIEDDGVYLSAVQSDLNPALYPHDSEFFRVQLQATLFDKWVAGFIHLTHIPIAATELLWQFASIVLIVIGCWNIARTLFSDARAQWAGVALVASMLTLPVSGTALYLADQHLHPRNLATALILLAVSRIMVGQRLQAVPLLILSFVLHPIMGAIRHLLLLLPHHCPARSGSCMAAFPSQFARRRRSPGMDLRTSHSHLAPGLANAKISLSLPLDMV